VGGLEVMAFPSCGACADYVLAEIRHGKGGGAVAVNAENVISCLENSNQRDLVQQFNVPYPDGAGVVLAMRQKGIRSARVPGADLWLEILRRAAPAELRIALIGARPEVLELTRQKIESEWPHIRVLFATDGFEGMRDAQGVVAAIKRAAPELILIAMGSPRQEQLVQKLRHEYAEGFYMGLGGSFDVYCGKKRRAPKWMQKIGLEWLFRFLSEPSRAPREKKRMTFLGMLIARRL
jgi:UDP-N-acetyl-D-mannosaminouronate:lipid I N-acetyl-D-mannosaminouronosyltransferase